MRVLLIANSAVAVGGGEVGLELLADGLLAHGHRPLILLPGPGSLAARFERRAIPIPIVLAAQAIRPLAAEADLIHTFGPRGLCAATLARTAKPVIFHALVEAPHELDPLLGEIPDRLICNSRATARRFPSHPDPRVIYNGVPAPRRPAAPLPLTASEKHVGVIGRPAPWKGQLEVLPAVEALVAERPDVDVVFAGLPGGPVSDAITAAAARSGGRIQMLGWVPDMRDHLGELDLIVIPSQTEGFCRVAAEALRAGIPVVARRVGGLVEVLAGLHDPWLPDDPVGWKDKIVQHLDHPPDSAATLRERGARFSMEVYLSQILAEYDELTVAARARM
jgi:glycosyltransferase involved in cell wall biosynthesis